MCGKKEEDEGECSQSIHQSIQNYQEQLFLHHQLQQQQQQQQYGVGGGGGRGGGLLFPEISPILPWSFSPVHTFNPVQFSSTNTVREQQQQHHHDPFLVPPPPPPPPPPPLPPTSSSSYGGFFNRRAASALQFAYDHHHHNPSSSTDHHHHLRIISDQVLGSSHVHQPGSSSHPFGSLQAELGKMTAQEIMDAKALAASKSHSEAERRRRERINNHLAKLRSLLPSTTKTDKASLLAEVIQHVKELKRQTSQIAEASPVPTENDELTVDNASDEDGKFIIKASLCCEDRTDLLPDLIKTLKALRLRTLKAEITTLGGRVKNVLFITGDHHSHDHDQESSSKVNEQHSLNSIQEALKAVMERTATSTPPSGDDQMTTTTTTSSGSIKRQRTNNNMNMLEQQQQHRSL